MNFHGIPDHQCIYVNLLSLSVAFRQTIWLSMLLETFAEVLERTKVLRAQQKRVDGSGQQCRSAFDITDQRDFFLPISSDPT